MKRREFMMLARPAVAGAVFGGIVGVGTDDLLNGRPGWAAQEFGVSVEAGKKIETNVTTTAGVSGTVVGAIAGLMMGAGAFEKSKSKATGANPAEGGHRPSQGPSPAAS